MTVEKVEIISATTSLTADGSTSTSLTVTLTDSAKQAVSGQAVTITTDKGQVSLVKDNGDGTYSATHTAGRQAGTATLTAKTWQGQMATLQLTLTAQDTPVGTSSSFTLSRLKPEQTGQAGRSLSDLVKLQAQGGL